MTEFSRIIILEESEPFISIKASAAECAHLANRFSFDLVAGLEGDFNFFEVEEKDCFCLKGKIIGKAIVDKQEICVDDPIELFIVRHEKYMENFSILEDVEISDNGTIDIGEIMAQYLYLKVI